MVCGGDEECNDCYLTISAPDLEIDNNGYYHIDFINSDIQTFTTLKSETGFYYEKIWWFSNTMHLAQHGTNENWEYLVNTSSYTNDEGIGHTVFSAWEENIGDTVKVICTYTDNCNIWYSDSLYIIVNP